MILNWIGIVVALLLGVWAIKILISAEKCDKEHHEYCRNHPNIRLTRSFHSDIMAGYYTAAIVIGATALAILGINVMELTLK